MRKIISGMSIENPVLGQRVFLVKMPAETGGRYFEMEYTCQPHTGEGVLPLHYHPTYIERFDILKGNARYLLGKDEHTATPGEQVVFPPKIVHLHPWSDSNEELRVRQVSEANPPDTAGLVANLNAVITFFGLARSGKVDKNGLPNFLQRAVCGITTIPGAVPAEMSVGMARIVIGFLALLGRMQGYRVSYPEYGEV